MTIDITFRSDDILILTCLNQIRSLTISQKMKRFDLMSCFLVKIGLWKVGYYYSSICPLEEHLKVD